MVSRGKKVLFLGVLFGGFVIGVSLVSGVCCFVVLVFLFGVSFFFPSTSVAPTDCI